MAACRSNSRRLSRLSARRPAPPRERRPEGEAHEIRSAAPGRLQELLRSDRVQDRTRPDRRRRPQRLRQIESRRSAALGDGRKLVQEHARVGDGRRHLLRRRRAAVAQPRRSRPDARQFRSPRARRLQRRRDDRSHAPHRARVRARPIASTAARCGRATCSCCSPTPPPARARRRWCARARSARSSPPSRRRGG